MNFAIEAGVQKLAAFRAPSSMRLAQVGQELDLPVRGDLFEVKRPAISCLTVCRVERRRQASGDGG